MPDAIYDASSASRTFDDIIELRHNPRYFAEKVTEIGSESIRKYAISNWK